MNESRVLLVAALACPLILAGVAGCTSGYGESVIGGVPACQRSHVGIRHNDRMIPDSKPAGNSRRGTPVICEDRATVTGNAAGDNGNQKIRICDC